MFFSRIYELQELDVPFNDVYQLLSAVDVSFYQMLNVTLKDHIKPYDYNEAFVNEFIFLATNINYNQDISKVHAFVGK